MALPEGLTSQLAVTAGGVLAPLCLGAGIAGAVGLSWRGGRGAYLAWSYLIGQLALAPLCYLWLATGQPVPGRLLPLLAFVVGAALLTWQRTRRSRTRTAEPSRAPPIDWPLLAATLLPCLLFVDACLTANLSPIVQGDEASIWTAKARLLAGAPDFAIGFGLSSHVGHPAYPLLNPLVQVLAFASAGDLTPFESRIPIQAFTLALLLLLADALARSAPRLAAIAIVIALGTAPELVSNGVTACADTMLAFGVLAAAIAWLRWQASGAQVWWRLFCFALAAVVATKNEGLMLALVLLLAAGAQQLLACTRGDRRHLLAPVLALGGQWLWLALPAATVAAGAWFDAEYGLVTDLVDPSRGDGMGLVERALRWFPDRAGTVLAWYGELLVDPGSRWLVLLGLVAGAAVLPQRARKAFVVPWLLLVGALAAYMLVFVGTTNPLPWHLATAAPRTILHVTPLAALVLGLALGPRPTAHGLSSPG